MRSKIVGALWTKQKDGMEYYSGVLQDLHGNINIAVFPNHRKEVENQPDFNIVISFGNKVEKTESLPEIKKNGKKKKEDTPF